MDFYGSLFARVLYPAWESGLRRRPTLRRLRYLEQTQWRPRAELEAIQAGALRRLLTHAYANVPHYQRAFAAAGITPRDIADARDLGKLPILGREVARDTVEDRTARGGAALEIRKSTSGTMGRPLVFGYERASEYWRTAMKMRGYGWAGYQPGQRALYFWGAGPPAGNTKPTLASRLRALKVKGDRAIRREHYMDCGRRGERELDEVVSAIRRDRPEVLVCYSQAVADLARHVVARNLRDWDTIPVICGAERLYPADRAVVEQAFGPAVFETYGCREVMLVATECDAHAGLHTSMETLVVEVVVREGTQGDNGTARPARPGELGEVVITDLTNHAMPFIRYANGDLAVAGDAGACSCGRALPRLASVEGRVAETLIDGTGARVNGLVFNVVIAHIAHAIRQFQVVQHKDRSVTLRVAPTSTFDGSIEATLRATWERYLTGVPVRLEMVDDIAASPSGKRQVVVVERVIRALVVSYVFPPTGGAGVGRALKLVKYLGHHGVRASVLTAANPSVPVQDQSLLRDVPADVEVQRVRTFEPGYAVKRMGWAGSGPAAAKASPSLGRQALGWAVGLGRQALMPDPQVLWQPAAQLALGQRLVRGVDDVILISAPPFSQFMLAPLARLRPGVGVVLDYRDEWSTVREVYEMKATLPARAGAALETSLLRAAHMVTTATEAFRQNLLARFPFLAPEQVVAIPNGYDPDDFPATLSGPPADAREMTVTYAGTIFKLTSARGLLGAVRRLHQAEPALARRLRVRFLGRIVETELDAYEGTEALGVERAGYLPHDEITPALAASHLALCLLDEAPFVERIYPAKIFELMHLAKTFGLRVLTLSPPGVLADLVAAHRVGPLLAPRDEEAIAAFLAAELRAFVAGTRPAAPAPVDVERFDRRVTAGQFAQVMALARDRARG